MTALQVMLREKVRLPWAKHELPKRLWVQCAGSARCAVILAVGGGKPYKPEVASAPDARAKSSEADDTLRHR